MLFWPEAKRGQATKDKADREPQKPGVDAMGTFPRITLVCELCSIVARRVFISNELCYPGKGRHEPLSGGLFVDLYYYQRNPKVTGT